MTIIRTAAAIVLNRTARAAAPATEHTASSSTMSRGTVTDQSMYRVASDVRASSLGT